MHLAIKQREKKPHMINTLSLIKTMKKQFKIHYLWLHRKFICQVGE